MNDVPSTDDAAPMAMGTRLGAPVVPGDSAAAMPCRLPLLAAPRLQEPSGAPAHPQSRAAMPVSTFEVRFAQHQDRRVVADRRAHRRGGRRASDSSL